MLPRESSDVYHKRTCFSEDVMQKVTVLLVKRIQPHRYQYKMTDNSVGMISEEFLQPNLIFLSPTAVILYT